MISCSLSAIVLPQLVQDVGRVEAGVVAQLPCDHLECLGHGSDDKLLLASDGSAVVAQVLGKFHVNGSTSRDNRVILHSTPDDHDGVVEGPLGLLHELLGTATKDNCAGLRLGAAAE